MQKEITSTFLSMVSAIFHAECRTVVEKIMEDYQLIHIHAVFKLWHMDNITEEWKDRKSAVGCQLGTSLIWNSV